jgi:hypothetical protein
MDGASQLNSTSGIHPICNLSQKDGPIQLKPIQQASEMKEGAPC